MAFVNRNKDSDVSWKSYILPVYIVLSFIFILFVLFSYMKGMVYTLGMQRGYNQWTLETISKLADQAWQCNPIPVNYGETTFQLINISCIKNESQKEDSNES